MRICWIFVTEQSVLTLGLLSRGSELLNGVLILCCGRTLLSIETWSLKKHIYKKNTCHSQITLGVNLMLFIFHKPQILFTDGQRNEFFLMAPLQYSPVPTVDTYYSSQLMVLDFLEFLYFSYEMQSCYISLIFIFIVIFKLQKCIVYVLFVLCVYQL